MVFGVYLFGENLKIKSQVNELNSIVKNTYKFDKPQLEAAIKELQSEKDLYADQLNRQSSFFMFWVTMLFVIFGLFGITVFYKIIDGRIKDAKSAIRTDYKEQKKDYEIKSKIHDDEILEFRNEIIDLKSKVHSNIGNVQFIISSDKNQRDDVILVYSVLGCESIALANSFKNDPLHKPNIVYGLKLALSVLNKPKLESLKEKLLPESKEFKDTITALSELSKFDDNEIKDLCANVRIKLNELHNTISVLV